jgi:hypothetical protein
MKFKTQLFDYFLTFCVESLVKVLHEKLSLSVCQRGCFLNFLTPDTLQRCLTGTLELRRRHVGSLTAHTTCCHMTPAMFLRLSASETTCVPF